MMEASFGSWKDFPTDADDIGAPFHFLVQPLDGVRAVQLGAMLARKGHVGQHVVLAPRHGF
ncbi:hypothetical protein ACTTAI_08715 [Rhodobacter capsulatus]|uniref:hypothetical protein n=1 Tax=Rhodobacter capsulatus TaxID=1061 RepID=UPI0040283EE8